jgi:hypothetical protein
MDEMVDRGYGDDSPHLGRFQFFVLTPQKSKPGTPN